MNYNIDKNILVLMVGVMVVSLGIFGFKAINNDPCGVVNFDVEANQFRVGEIIRFKDYSENASDRIWTFGDDSEPRYDVNPFHTYETPGEYEILLTVNGKCELVKQIVIEQKLSVIDSSRIAKFEIPNTIKAGELFIANDLTKGATSWEWRFGETAEVNSTYQNPSYSFKTAGLKTVTLIVNGDPRYSSQKRITVTPNNAIKETPPPTKKRTIAPSRNEVSILPYEPKEIKSAPDPSPVVKNNTPPPVEAKKKVPQISKNAFANKIIKVGLEEQTAKDFDVYLCGNLQVTTMAKGKKTTFVEFCEKIKGKKIKIKSLEIFKNKKSNCIEYISVDYSKGLL